MTPNSGIFFSTQSYPWCSIYYSISSTVPHVQKKQEYRSWLSTTFSLHVHSRYCAPYVQLALNEYFCWNFNIFPIFLFLEPGFVYEKFLWIYSWVCQLCNRLSIGLDNGVSPIRRQAIIKTDARLLSIVPLATNFSELLIETQIFSFTKMLLEISFAKWRPFCPGGDELNSHSIQIEL